jgi:hypothetical protein
MKGRKRVLAIVAGILVARSEDGARIFLDNKPSPRTESMVAAAVQWAERIMRKIDNVRVTNKRRITQPCPLAVLGLQTCIPQPRPFSHNPTLQKES